MKITLDQAVKVVRLHLSMMDDSWSSLTDEERQSWSDRAAKAAEEAWNKGKWPWGEDLPESIK